ncbi:MAG: DHA2 family efflux MFS transporter permease subunit [Solirubrobacteraceae bacterium]
MTRSYERRTLAIVSVAVFMVVLDNLVVTVALPSIRHAFGASVQSLEWTINAYTLSYAVLLLTGAALGDRFGRQRVFLIGLSVFTAASACAALAPTTGLLIAARAIQGSGAAIATPLTLTLLAEAFPVERRGMALGVWSAIGGVAIALGPLVGGGVITALNWHWIFWINVPVGVVLLPFAARGLRESYGPHGRLDLPGLGLGSTGLLGIVYGLVHSQSAGFGASTVLGSLTAGVALLGAFVIWELRTDSPMLPMEFFARRSFLVTNIASLAMYFGMFGSIFFLTQYLQLVLGNTPLQAGLKLLVWTGSTMVVSPFAGIFSARYGSRRFIVAGLALQSVALAWIALTATTTTAYSTVIVPFVLGGTGMALFFAPSAAAILAAVRPDQAGQASGAANAIREVGGVFGVAVLASVFSGSGSYATGHAFVSGLVPALWVGVSVLGAFALVVALVPWSGRQAAVSARSGAGTPATAEA